MRFSTLVSAPLCFGIALLAPTPILRSEQPPPATATTAAVGGIPDAPEPQIELTAAPQAPADPQPPQQPAPAADPTPVPGTSSSAQPAAQQLTIEKTQRQKADEQIKAEEHQRGLGIIPSFNTSYVSDAVSLTATQKINLAFHSAVDPFTFAAAVTVAGLHEAFDDDTGFGWGAEGFGKRSGAAYLDAFDGTMIGNGFLPAIFHQDPRLFRLGHGTVKHRLLYSIATSYICKHDNSGRWEPNYSNVGGNIISGAISNLYYPSQNSGWGETITNGFIVTTEGTVGGVFNEFWPDISRRFFHKDPTNGLDAQMQEEDKNKKAEQPQK